MNKKVISYALAATMIGSLFTFNVQAKEQITDSISLPVQLYDYDADGLFYEYALYNGMESLGGVFESNEVTKGLVEDTLGDNGLPVYKKESIESAAKTIYKNLALGKEEVLNNKNEKERIYTTYSIFKKFMNENSIPTSTKYEMIFGDSINPFYTKGWTLENTQSSGTDGVLHSGLGTIWQQDNDGIANYGVQDHLTKSFDVTPQTTYKFEYWRDVKGLDYQIKGNTDRCILLDSTDVEDINGSNGPTFNTGTNDSITIDIYPKDTSSDKGKIAALNLLPENNNDAITYHQLLGVKPTNFLKEGWVSTNYDSMKKDMDSGELYEEGVDYWKQDGDGVKCLNDSSIVFNTDIKTNQCLKIKYYIDVKKDENEKELDSDLTLDILDDTNKVLATEKVVNGFFPEIVVDVPQGTGNIKLRLNGKADSARIAALNVRGLGKILSIGNYNETENKYNQGKLKTVDDCSSCMDYTYLRLKNFYNTDFALNKVDNKYNKMILKEDTTQNDGKVSYVFDSTKDIKYDATNKTFYNGENSENEGFFPLDHIGTEKLHNHNYHFGMIVDGDFIYKKGAKQYFSFSGDDDVYVFINGKLVIDLGGAHHSAGDTFCVEEYAKENGIDNGEKCEFKMFYLERHTTDSNCKIETNLNIGNHAEYKFESGTKGMKLPEGILALTPIDENEYYKDQEVQIDRKHKKFVDYVDTENNGVWKFVDWDANSKVMTESGIQFVGKWIFVANDTLKPNDSTDNPSNDNKQDPKDNPQVTPVVSGDLHDTEVKATSSQNMKKSSKVKTGDDTHLMLYVLFVVLSFMGILFLKKKAHN